MRELATQVREAARALPATDRRAALCRLAQALLDKLLLYLGGNVTVK